MGSALRSFGRRRLWSWRRRLCALTPSTWQPRNQPPLVRASLALSRAKHLRCHILPAFGGRRLDTITPTALEDFRALVTRPVEAAGKGLKLKTARDIVDSTFRALVRDARTIDYVTAYGVSQPVAIDPFAVLRWKREEAPGPDPFTEDERDALLAYFWERKRSYHAFVYTLFHTGMRTGEAVGLRWDDIDLRRGQVTIRRSRTYGEDNAPKTQQARRTITVQPEVVAVLRALQPIRVGEGAFVFVSPAGCALDGDRFVEKHWRPALRATSIRPRKLYASRHSFISVALTRGAKAKWLAGYCGTSLEMLEKHYSRWMDGDDDQLALLRTKQSAGTRRTA
jgi:integrase